MKLNKRNIDFFIKQKKLHGMNILLRNLHKFGHDFNLRWTNYSGGVCLKLAQH